MNTSHAHTTIRGFYKKSILATFVLTLLTTLSLHAQSYPQDADPPERVARLSILQGNVSLQPAGVDQFSQAEPNYPLTNGDRVYVDNSSFAELQSDALAIRMGLGADLSLTSMTDQVAQLGLAQGSIHIRSWNLQNGASIEIDTPNGTITILQPGDVRIDSYPQDDTTVVTVNSGEAEATGPNLSQAINPGQALRLTGSNPIYVEYVELAPGDNLDRFDQDRDRRQMAGRAASQQYVNPDMIGYSDLQEYGEWSSQSDYGQVWYPRNVDRDWTPYHNGHWAWIAPWGWTWVEAEPWGFAPFHYGRWASFNGRWGWIPGPTIVRPVYSPALVAFVGGPSFSISAGFGAGNGAGLTAWFPLGPRETYVPWYHASSGYVNRVNVTNIYNRNVTEVRNVYNNRTTNIYVNNTTVNNITYVNRTVATTVVPQRSFAAGRPVASAAVHVDQKQLAQAQVMPHPMITPTRAIVAPAPARAVPVNIARPVLQTRVGLAQAVPGAQAHPVPVHTLTPQQQQAVKVQPLPNGQRPIQQPAPAPVQRQPIQQTATQPVSRQAPVERATPTPNPPAHPVPTQQAQPTTQFNQPRPQPTAPINQQRPQQEAPINQQRPQPAAPVNQQRPQPEAPINQQRPQQSAPINQQRPEPPVQASQPKPQPRPVDQPRPLINRSEPPPAQPTFVQQRQAIQKTDPGRPLGPQQVENLRNGRPAGPHEQPEPIAHPAARAPQPPQPKNESKQSPPK
ncbi:DUF6600 domain-containing protein [Tunturibacter empetritectus]|uniref:FecR family protein n=1 Tax=Tunturiibacter empetritectus TaxID=3069691 RepID=A0A7W8IGE9_9BACT|nr:DUF6600 domain-containing protein [Edaphobacter lichenicola]MBB5316734.1 hypothetical protein [Edaphobacter lichenicola]